MGSQSSISEKELEKNKRANRSNCAWGKMANLGFTEPKCLTESRKRTKPGKGSKINKTTKIATTKDTNGNILTLI